MVDDVRDHTETAESAVSGEYVDRARLARERREAEQRKRLEELRAHAAAAQAQREKREEDRRRRQAEQRARDDDRRVQVEERKRAIWEASVSRREALLQREREREERLERSRTNRLTSPRSAFAFGSSTPRLLEPVDTTGFFRAARSTNPIDQMNYFDSLASSTTNVMFASAPLTGGTSALQLNLSDNDNAKDEFDRSPQPMAWSSVARRRTDLVPTLPASRAPEPRSGDTTPGSRPGSAMSTNVTVVRRATSAPRRPRPASIAGTGVNTPKGGIDVNALSLASSPAVSRDASRTSMAASHRTPRPVSAHVTHKQLSTAMSTSTPADGKPPIQRKPKTTLPKDHEKTSSRKALSVSPGRVSSTSPSPNATKEPSVEKEVATKNPRDKSQVCANEVSQKLEALQIDADTTQVTHKENENKQTVDKIEEPKTEPKHETAEKVEVQPQPPQPQPQTQPQVQVQPQPQEKAEVKEEKRENTEKTDESEMTASMTARRITTEEEAKAALAERRRKAREELERQAELERIRLQREAEEEAERQRQEEERQRREEQEAKELAALQRRLEDEKLRKAIEAQQQLEREEAERKQREELERQARIKEEEEKRKAMEEEARLKREEAERQELERIARKQRVEAIMARTRLKKNEQSNSTESQQSNNQTAEKPNAESNTLNNGNVADLLGMSEQNNTMDKTQEAAPVNNATPEQNNGNINTSNHGHISANFIQTERINEEMNQQVDNKQLQYDENFTSHNGHNHNNHPLVQNI